jgi:hypothetical protein
MIRFVLLSSNGDCIVSSFSETITYQVFSFCCDGTRVASASDDNTRNLECCDQWPASFVAGALGMQPIIMVTCMREPCKSEKLSKLSAPLITLMTRRLYVITNRWRRPISKFTRETHVPPRRQLIGSSYPFGVYGCRNIIIRLPKIFVYIRNWTNRGESLESQMRYGLRRCLTPTHFAEFFRVGSHCSES